AAAGAGQGRVVREGDVVADGAGLVEVQAAAQAAAAAHVAGAADRLVAREGDVGQQDARRVLRLQAAAGPGAAGGRVRVLRRRGVGGGRGVVVERDVGEGLLGAVGDAAGVLAGQVDVDAAAQAGGARGEVGRRQGVAEAAAVLDGEVLQVDGGRRLR